METVLEYKGYKIDYVLQELSVIDYIKHCIKNNGRIGHFRGKGEYMSIKQVTPNIPIVKDLIAKRVFRHELDHADIHIDNMYHPDLQKKQSSFDRKTLNGRLQIHYYL